MAAKNKSQCLSNTPLIKKIIVGITARLNAVLMFGLLKWNTHIMIYTNSKITLLNRYSNIFSTLENPNFQTKSGNQINTRQEYLPICSIQFINTLLHLFFICLFLTAKRILGISITITINAPNKLTQPNSM